MRYSDLIEDVSDRMPNPFGVVEYDDGQIGHIYRNPPAGLLKKIIGDFDCRALLDHQGNLLVWPELDCYHNDVRKGMNVGKMASLMLGNPDRNHGHAFVSVKGFSNEPEPFLDEDILKMLYGNRGMVELFGPDFAVDTYDWG